MSTLVNYELRDSIAAIVMDDGKANALSPQMFAEVNAALDRAAGDRSAVVLIGREGVFSGGFDLRVLRAGGPEAVALLRDGFELSARLLAFPTPVVIGCTGHAVAMGAFLLLSGDYRVGAAGAYRLVANEVAIGLTMPGAAIAICRQRLAPAHFSRAVINAETYSPDDAVGAGFLDQVVEASEVQNTAMSVAVGLMKLNMAAHAASKLRARDSALKEIRAAIDADYPVPDAQERAQRARGADPAPH